MQRFLLASSRPHDPPSEGKIKHTALPFHKPKRTDTALPFRKSEPAITVDELTQYATGWLLDCEIERHSQSTRTNRRFVLDKLAWYVRQKQITCINALALKQFLAYVVNGHKEEGGRWGDPRFTSPTSPGTVATYHRILRAFFNWIVKERGLCESPLATTDAPIDRPDDIEPFTQAQVDALLDAARQSNAPLRDEAILLFLLDSGARVSEMCSLRIGDLDINEKTAFVEGKGGKRRQIYIGKKTSRVIWKYIAQSKQERSPADALFQATKGPLKGEALTPTGVRQLINRLAVVAGVSRTRCSPHTFRHTFAVMYLRDGGDQFSLMRILGHTNVKMTSRYVLMAQADVADQHRQHSPVDRMKKKL